MRKRSILLSAGLAATTLAGGLAAQNLTHVRLSSSAAEELSRSFERQGYDVVEGSVRPGSLELVVGDPELATLESLGFSLQVIQVGRPLSSMQDELGATPERPGYPDLAAVNAELAAAAAAFPSICQLVNLTQTYGTPPTAEGRDILAVKVSDDVALEEDEPSFLVVGAHHCRETVTPLIALEALSRLTTGYGVDPTITAAVDANEVWIAPVWNPDGYEYVFTTNNLWRKNRRPNGGGSFGVDLNRNYPTGWTGACSGSTAPNSCTYKGPSSASEPETQLMIAWSNDQRWTKVLDYHSFGREVLWGYDCLTHPLEGFLQTDAIRLANVSGYNGSNRPPSADGEEYQWQIAARGSHAFLLETHVAFQPAIASAMAEAEQLWPGILAFLNRAVPVTGHVVDACTGAPLEATISVAGVSFANGELLTSGGPFGRYDLFLPPGAAMLTFEAAGYAPQTVAVTVPETGTEVVEVALDALVALSLEGAPSGSSLGGGYVEVGAPCAFAGGAFGVVALPADAGARLAEGVLLGTGRLDPEGRGRLALPEVAGAERWSLVGVVASPAATATSAPLPLSGAR